MVCLAQIVSVSIPMSRQVLGLGPDAGNRLLVISSPIRWPFLKRLLVRREQLIFIDFPRLEKGRMFKRISKTGSNDPIIPLLADLAILHPWISLSRLF